MGFFQSLKDDLSSAMNELINDENEELVNAEDGSEYTEDESYDSEYNEELLSDELLSDDLLADEGLSEEVYEDNQDSYTDSDEVEECNEDVIDQGIMDLVSMEPEEPRSARSAINSLKEAGRRLEKKQLQEALDNGALGTIIDEDTNPVMDASEELVSDEADNQVNGDDFDVAAMLDSLDLDALVKESSTDNTNNSDDTGVQINIEDILGSLEENNNSPAEETLEENTEREAVNIDDLLKADLEKMNGSVFNNNHVEETVPEINSITEEQMISEPVNEVVEQIIPNIVNDSTEQVIPEAVNEVQEPVIPEAVNEVQEPVIPEAVNEVQEQIIPEVVNEVQEPVIPKVDNEVQEQVIPEAVNEVQEQIPEVVNIPVESPVVKQVVKTEPVKPVSKAPVRTVAHNKPQDTPVLMPNVPAYVPKISNEFSDETAVITKGMRVVGNVASNGNMDVYGTIVGDISIIGKLSVSGTIVGKSKAHEVFADGAEINGDINVTGTVKVGQSSVIIGNISSTSAVIAGAVKGDIDVQGPVVLDSSAIVMGNIKSMSVQINNGAVIEGLCSQCYAQVSPTSFFDDFKKTASLINRK